MAELLRNPDALRARIERKSHVFGAAQARVAQANAETRSAKLYLNPVVDASLSSVAINGSPALADSIWNAGVSETWELGKRGPRRAAAELHAGATRKEREQTLLDQLSLARRSLAEVLFLNLRSATLDEAYQSAERGAELERVRYEQKALSGVDYDRLLLDLAIQRAELARSRAEARAALASCTAVLLGECDLEGAEERDLEVSLQVPQLDTETALSRRPDLQALALESDSARRSAELASRRAIPDVTLRIGYQRDNSLPPSSARDSVSLGVSMPLALADHGQHDAARALARADELTELRAAATLDSRAALRGLSERQLTISQTLIHLEQESLPLAKSVLESSQRAFDNGGVSLTDLLLARRNYVALRLTLLERRFELFTVQNDLIHELGVQPAH